VGDEHRGEAAARIDVEQPMQERENSVAHQV
jgi:hypothetical protein